MSKAESQPELTPELKMNMKTNIVVSGIKLIFYMYLKKKKEYCTNHMFHVLDERQLKYVFF